MLACLPACLPICFFSLSCLYFDLVSQTDAKAFITFISFLKERSVSRGHLLHHISLASKVNSYIKTKACDDEHIYHCNRLGDWFQTLGSQVTNITPITQKKAPDLQVIYGWVDALGEGAKQVVDK